MKITKVETVVYRNVTQVHAGGIGWTWVRIHTDTGAYGWGETFPAPDSEKAVILSDYAPVLLGRHPRDIERLWNENEDLSDCKRVGGGRRRSFLCFSHDFSGQLARPPRSRRNAGKLLSLHGFAPRRTRQLTCVRPSEARKFGERAWPITAAELRAWRSRRKGETF